MNTGLQEIGAVARQLGIAPSTLRTWERRYRIVVPQRGERGQRLYDTQQVVTLRRVLAQLRRGARARAAHDLAAAPARIGTVRRRVDPSRGAPAQARHAVDELLGVPSDSRFAFHLRLVASELVKNAVLYGSEREPIRIEMALYRDWADVKVQNGGVRMNMRNLRTRRRPGGRGLEIVDALAEAWAIETDAFGTKITVRVPTGSLS